MANKYPRYRITVELVEPAPAMQDAGNFRSAGDAINFARGNK